MQPLLRRLYEDPLYPVVFHTTTLSEGAGLNSSAVTSHRIKMTEDKLLPCLLHCLIRSEADVGLGNISTP